MREGAEEPEGTHLDAMVTGAATDKQTNKQTNMELDGTHLAATEESKQMLKQHIESLKDLVAQSSRIGWARLSELEEKANGDGLQDAGDESDSLRVRFEPGEIRAEAPDAISAADTRAQERWYITLDERVTALVRQLDEKVVSPSQSSRRRPRSS